MTGRERNARCNECSGGSSKGASTAQPVGEYNTYKSSWLLRGCNFVFNCIFDQAYFHSPCTFRPEWVLLTPPPLLLLQTSTHHVIFQCRFVDATVGHAKNSNRCAGGGSYSTHQPTAAGDEFARFAFAHSFWLPVLMTRPPARISLTRLSALHSDMWTLRSRMYSQLSHVNFTTGRYNARFPGGGGGSYYWWKTNK